MDLKQIVLQFNDCITARDIDGLASLMTDDHSFIDSENNAVRGKAASVEAWRGFFEQFPDYKNTFTRLTSNANRVTVVGYSTCSFAPLDGPALWTALVRDGQVAEWRVYEDTPDKRRQLDIPSEG